MVPVDHLGPVMTHHDSSNVFRVISVQVKLEGNHLVIVRLQLTLHHPVHFIRELQRRDRMGHQW